MPRNHERTAISDQDLESKVSELLDKFFEKRIERLDQLKLHEKIKSKSPYLLRAIGVVDANEIVEEILDAHISSSDETTFGNIFFEELAKWSAEAAVNGINDISVQIATNKGIDVSIQKNGGYVEAIAIKSGPNIFNAQSKERQKQDFSEFRKRMKKAGIAIYTVVGYCYGSKNQRATNMTEMEELAGQAFWEHITGDSQFYLRIMNAMKARPDVHRQKYNIAYANAKNKFTKEFSETYTQKDGSIDWEGFAKINSGAKLQKTDGKSVGTKKQTAKIKSHSSNGE